MSHDKPNFQLSLHNINILRRPTSSSNPTSNRTKSSLSKTKPISMILKTDPKTCRYCYKIQKSHKSIDNTKILSNLDMDMMMTSMLSSSSSHDKSKRISNINKTTHANCNRQQYVDGSNITSNEGKYEHENKNRMKYKDINELINKALYKKYSSSQNYYYTKDINEILSKNKTIRVVKYKDLLVYDEDDEYLKRYYAINEWPNKITLLSEYYKYHKDIPRVFILPILIIINRYYHKTRKIYYMQIAKMLSKQRDIKNQGNNDNNNTQQPYIQTQFEYNLQCSNPQQQQQSGKNLPYNGITNTYKDLYSQRQGHLQTNQYKKKEDILIRDRILDNLDLTMDYIRDAKECEKSQKSERNQGKMEQRVQNSKLKILSNDRKVMPVIAQVDTKPIAEKSLDNSNTIQDLNLKLSEIIANSHSYIDKHNGEYNYDNHGYNFDYIENNGINLSIQKEEFSTTNLNNFLNFISLNPTIAKHETGKPNHQINYGMSKSTKLNNDDLKIPTTDIKNEKNSSNKENTPGIIDLNRLAESISINTRKNDENKVANSLKTVKTVDSNNPNTIMRVQDATVNSNNNGESGQINNKLTLNSARGSSQGFYTYRSQPNNDIKCISPELPNMQLDQRQEVSYNRNQMQAGVGNMVNVIEHPIINDLDGNKFSKMLMSPQSRIQKIKYTEQISATKTQSTNAQSFIPRENSATHRPITPFNIHSNPITNSFINQAKIAYSSPQDLETNPNHLLLSKPEFTHQFNGISRNSSTKSSAKKETIDQGYSPNALIEYTGKKVHLKHNRAISNINVNLSNHKKSSTLLNTQQIPMITSTPLPAANNSDDKKQITMSLSTSKCSTGATKIILQQGTLTQNSARNGTEEGFEIDFLKTIHRPTKSDANVLKMASCLHLNQENIKKPKRIATKTQPDNDKLLQYNDLNNEFNKQLLANMNLQSSLDEKFEKNPNESKQFQQSLQSKLMTQGKNMAFISNNNSPNLTQKTTSNCKPRIHRLKNPSSISPDTMIIHDFQNGQLTQSPPLHMNYLASPQVYTYNHNNVVNIYLNGASPIITPFTSTPTIQKSEMPMSNIQQSLQKTNNMDKLRSENEPMGLNIPKKKINFHASPLRTFSKTSRISNYAKLPAKKL